MFCKILFPLSFLFFSSFIVPQINNLPVKFKGDAQIEVGSHYMGIEMHHSSPMIQRISFYYPTANSIDLSRDYWKRDSTFIIAAAITIDNKKEWIGLTPYQFELTPYSVKFDKDDGKKSIEISYQFCKDKAAMVVSYEITNTSETKKEFTFETHLELALKTCHSYRLIDKAEVEYNENLSGLNFNFDDRATQNAQVFIFNTGETPNDYSTKTSLISNDTVNTWWNNFSWTDNETNQQNKILHRPAANFLYTKVLSPGEKLKVVQIIGSCKKDERNELIQYLAGNYEKEVKAFGSYVTDEINKIRFHTNDSSLDKTYNWAKAVLAVNQHYINGSIQPMPCPAEYNFYFTHDVLLTDLAAVNFDLERVKKDLEFIISLADKNYIIPHAYYWRDSLYVTEFATPDNWNHFWFIILSGTYLRHSSDKELLNKLYPYLTKSLEETLQNRRDDLMWAYRPDWWDIGRNYGPRAFMTIQAIKAIREYIYISAMIGKNTEKLLDMENQANRMQQKLNEELWSSNYNYLINYWKNDSLDSHYYIGSLLAAHYNLLRNSREEKLVTTASEKLLDPKLGIYTVFPMDFHKMISFLKFAGNEGGDPFKYINGGIWSHGNTWYTLALIAAGKKKEAYDFIKNVMTLDGIMKSPNGQPAMYEYRNSNFTDQSVYGKIDKPQFMWFAGWYIYSLYHLFGISENEWNISFNPFLFDQQNNCKFGLAVNGRLTNVEIKDSGNMISEIILDGKNSYSYVFPANSIYKKAELILGKLTSPLLLYTTSTFVSAAYINNELQIDLSAFRGHENITRVVSPAKPKSVQLDGKDLSTFEVFGKDGEYEISINFRHSTDIGKLKIIF